MQTLLFWWIRGWNPACGSWTVRGWSPGGISATGEEAAPLPARDALPRGCLPPPQQRSPTPLRHGVTLPLLRARLQHAVKGAGGSMKSDWASGRKMSGVLGAGGVLGRCWSWSLQRMVRLKIGCSQPSPAFRHLNSLLSSWPAEEEAAMKDIISSTTLAVQVKMVFCS